MQTDALDLARHTARAGLSERLSWGVIEFQVTDLGRTVAFWTSALGLRVIEHDSQRAILGTGTTPLFVFHAGAEVPVRPRHLGLYHVAIGMPDQAEFSRLLARLALLRIPVSPTDHLMSKALYLSDPDGLEIEIALETPERFGRFGDMSRGLVLYDADGKPHNGRAPLDVRAELAHAEGADLEAELSGRAFIAHMHFKVADLNSAAAWFEGIGFARNLMLENWGFADMGAGAAYTHRLAMNVWAGPNLAPAPANMARLVRYALHVHDPAVIADIRTLLPAASGLTGRDPTGTEITLIPVPGT
ncbi:VOC family protein [Hoeflea ulvae]|uniref:VOC family protein n=1 Tax=Hoeflea ulvae TaxID=2983764 RepID=A0ABT3YLK6_9HYPH|nr:VOC family protein [Hoeflea ulvae]MCY0096738.1 VOC family protein [Hoeflea ulvae]